MQMHVTRTHLVAGMAGIVGLWLALVPALTHAAPAAGPVVITSIHMSTVTSGWATTPTALIHTVDGGEHWTNVTPPGFTTSGGDASAAPAEFLSAQWAWVAAPAPHGASSSSTNVLFRTSDGGRTWQRSTLPHARIAGQPTMPGPVTFIDPQHGWAVLAGSPGAGQFPLAIARTLDGGVHWTVVSMTQAGAATPAALPVSGAKSGPTFLTATTGWVTGSVPVSGFALFYVSHDGGRTWRHQALPLPAGHRQDQLLVNPPALFRPRAGALPVTFFGRTTNMTVIYQTRDGGTTWQPTTPIPAAYNPFFITPRYGWALTTSTTARGSLLYRTADGGYHWTVVDGNPTPGSSGDFDFVTTRVGWAIGDSGPASHPTPYLTRTLDGGYTWQIQHPLLDS